MKSRKNAAPKKPDKALGKIKPEPTSDKPNKPVESVATSSKAPKKLTTKTKKAVKATKAPIKTNTKTTPTISHRWRKLSVKAQRAIIVAAILLAVGLLVFVEVIRPNQDAEHYTHRLETASKPLEDCFTKLAKTTELQIYYAPDISYAIKSADTAKILQQISACREEVKTFDQAAHQLLVLRFAGYTPTYREAKVNQRQAFDVVGQSNDVLNQYQNMATFLADYYQHIEAFRTYTSQLTTDGGYFDAARLNKLSKQADDLRTRSVSVQQLTAPAEFQHTKDATSAMFAMAADGFDKLVDGYMYNSDYYISSGYASVDQAVATYDSTVSNLPFNQLVSSYIPKQVVQLPSKVNDLLAASSE